MADTPDRTAASDDAPDLFHVTQMSYHPEDGDTCHFLVTRLSDGHSRHIVVRTDEKVEWFDFEADGEFYDPSQEPEYLTGALIDDTTETLRGVKRLHSMVDVNTAIASLLRASAEGRVN